MRPSHLFRTWGRIVQVEKKWVQKLWAQSQDRLNTFEELEGVLFACVWEGKNTKVGGSREISEARVYRALKAMVPFWVQLKLWNIFKQGCKIFWLTLKISLESGREEIIYRSIGVESAIAATSWDRVDLQWILKKLYIICFSLGAWVEENCGVFWI